MRAVESIFILSYICPLSRCQERETFVQEETSLDQDLGFQIPKFLPSIQWHLFFLKFNWPNALSYTLLVVRMSSGPAFLENMIIHYLKIRNWVSIWPRNSTCYNIPHRPRKLIKKHLHSYASYRTFYKTPNLEATHVSKNRWLDEATMVHIYNGLVIGHKNKIYHG